jgi:hypothetical protein
MFAFTLLFDLITVRELFDVGAAVLEHFDVEGPV